MSDPQRRRQRSIRPGRFAQQLKGRQATEAQLRTFFNGGGFAEKARSGVFTTEILKDGHPSPPKADEPVCTRSQLIAYRDQDGKKVAEVHQYVRPDGKLGASGKPDPKMVLHDGILYYLTEP